MTYARKLWRIYSAHVYGDSRSLVAHRATEENVIICNDLEVAFTVIAQVEAGNRYDNYGTAPLSTVRPLVMR